MRYTAGLLFQGESLLLLTKIEPQWQRGLLNAVGGKCEDGESYADCMRREFKEEVGLEVAWDPFAVEKGPDYECAFFRARCSAAERRTIPARNDVGEEMNWYFVRNFLVSGRVVGNLRWLIPMAQDWRSIVAEIDATRDCIRDQPNW